MAIRFTLTFCLISLALVNSVHGQYKYGRYSRSYFYFGVEGTMGTKTFSVKSDIPAINGMKAIEQGFSLGMVGGGRTVLAKVKYGSYAPTSSAEEKVTFRNMELNVNTFPMEIFKTKNNFFKPYLITGFDRSQLRFIGNYSLPAPPPPPPPANPCPCICEGAKEEPIPVPEPAPSTTSPTEELSEDTVLGTVNVVRGTAGVGLIIHVPGKNKFINFFMEAHYGIPLLARSTSPAFDRTTVTGQLSLNAGLALGLSR